MKNSTIFFLLLISFPLQLLFAQTEKGDKELSIAASFMSRKFERADEAWHAINLATSIGIFVTDGFEIEPEILISKYKDEDMGIVLSGNLAYNFNTSNGNPVPFILGGAGYANTIIFLPRAAYEGDEDDNWTVINGGAGLKIFISKPIALRLEYRFQKFLGDTDVTNHIIFFGVSVFLE
jgi:hypothetical protein